MTQKGSNRRWTDEELSILKEEFPTDLNKNIGDKLNRSEMAVKHKARRLGLEKQDNHRIIKKVESTETPSFDNTEFNNFISGFVSGEGCFTYRNNTERNLKRFAFQVAVADVDEDIIYKIKDYLEAGNIYHNDSRDDEWKPTVQYRVQAIGEIASIIIPFFDQVGLYGTNKENQYKEWRTEFIETHNLTERFK